MTKAIDNIKISNRGRPKVDTEPVMVRLPRDQVRAVDDYRRAQDDLPSRPEAIRRLIAEALTRHR